MRLLHLGMLGENAGDKLLPVTVRDSISMGIGNAEWTARHVHDVVDDARLRLINQSDGLVVGGGGLFLRDTNPNEVSGWQWPCSLEALDSITVPFALFAVGYNRFRDQPDFSSRFTENVNLLADRSVFIGLRNHGSIEAMRAYLDPGLHHKLRYQPCPTTVTRLLYSHLLDSPDDEEADERRPISLNCAFDRGDLRFGDRRDEILDGLARAMLELSMDHPIEYFAHLKGDEAMLQHLDRHRVPYTLRRLYRSTPRQIVDAYRRPLVALGMRGHAQMIPFGCGRPIVSLASHDKLWFFLNDIGLGELGIEIGDDDVAGRLVAKVRSVAEGVNQVTQRMDAARGQLWRTTTENVEDLARSLER